MDLYLIRHAQSANNARPTELRVEDPEITETGHQQAERLAAWASKLQLTQLYTSAFLRTLQTTSYLQKATGLTPHVRVQLHEVGGCVAGTHAGNMRGRPGMNGPQIQEQFPGYVIPPDLSIEGWWTCKPYESYDAAQLRARNLLDWTLTTFAGTAERVAYVMHADFKMAFLDLLDLRLMDTPFNTSVTHLHLKDQQLELEKFNMVEHLTEPLLTS